MLRTLLPFRCVDSFAQVYDITKFLGDHPGGANILISVAGKDASEMFEMFHKASVLAKYGPTYVIGDVAK